MEENLVMDSMERAAQWLFVSGKACSQLSAHTNTIWEANSEAMLYKKPSVGLDGIPQQVLKDTADIIVRLAIIFEKL